jgi:hypothetical protein
MTSGTGPLWRSPRARRAALLPALAVARTGESLASKERGAGSGFGPAPVAAREESTRTPTRTTSALHLNGPQPTAGSEH